MEFGNSVIRPNIVVIDYQPLLYCFQRVYKGCLSTDCMTIAFTFMILHNLLKDKECHHHLFVYLISLCRHFEPTISPIDHTAQSYPY